MCRVLIAIIIILLCSCKERRVGPVVLIHPVDSAVQQDTMITYDLDDISAEGGEAAVSYMGGQVRSAEIRVFGETGQVRLSCDFKGDSVRVSEQRFSYTTDLMHVNSKKQIHLDSVKKYVMDLQGRSADPAANGSSEIFRAFREKVPFILGSPDTDCETLMHRLLYGSSLPEDLKKLHFSYSINEVRGDTVIIALTTFSDELHQDVPVHWVELNKRKKTLVDITADPDKPEPMTFEKVLLEKVLTHCELKN